MVADGEDPRVKIFERFQKELSGDGSFDRQLAHLEKAELDRYYDSYKLIGQIFASEAAVVLTMARQPMPRQWLRKVDPQVAQWLGAEVDPATLAAWRAHQQKLSAAETRNAKEVRARVTRKLIADPAMRGLLLGKMKALAAFTGGGEIGGFKPGKFFKDDWKKLLRYLGAALSAPSVTRADVEPAWFDFLSRDSKELHWWTMRLAVQSVITVDIGGGDPRTVGRDLQLAVTGV